VTVPVVKFTVKGEKTEPFQMTREYTVVYDGNCKVCTRLAGLLTKWDKPARLHVVASQQAGVKEAFPFIDEGDYKVSLQLVGPNQQRWQAAAAIEQLLNILPRGAMISWIFKIPFVRAIADRFYRWFARNRYRLGCGEHCDYRALSS
jgi:predicted DCC family thiol-disulfide oxidoreductase YuxK